jgi:hypothetical protein
MFCGGACRDVQRDSNNCGSCGFVCPTGQACGTGTCRAAVDVTILIDTTGSNATGVSNARSYLPSRLVAPLLALSNVQIGVSYTAEFPDTRYGSTGDRPFTGVIEPTNIAGTINTAINNTMAAGGGDAADAMVEGMAPLVGLSVTTYSQALVCSSGRVPGGCWRAGRPRERFANREARGASSPAGVPNAPD